MSGAAAPRRYRLTIDGMGCSGCAEAVRDALSALPGVRPLDIDHEAGTADLCTSVPLPTADAVAALADAGYALRSVEIVEDAE